MVFTPMEVCKSPGHEAPSGTDLPPPPHTPTITFTGTSCVSFTLMKIVGAVVMREAQFWIFSIYEFNKILLFLFLFSFHFFVTTLSDIVTFHGCHGHLLLCRYYFTASIGNTALANRGNELLFKIDICQSKQTGLPPPTPSILPKLGSQKD